MPSFADPARLNRRPARRPTRRRRLSAAAVDRLTDAVAIAVSLSLFVGLLWWMTVVASS